MAGRSKITPEETAELQSLYAELPGAIAEAAEAARTEQRAGQPEAALEGDEKVDTIIKRIVQLTDESDGT
jgi:thioredoxin-like negative regulator of GroEL